MLHFIIALSCCIHSCNLTCNVLPFCVLCCNIWSQENMTVIEAHRTADGARRTWPEAQVMTTTPPPEDQSRFLRPIVSTPGCDLPAQTYLCTLCHLYLRQHQALEHLRTFSHALKERDLNVQSESSDSDISHVAVRNWHPDKTQAGSMHALLLTGKCLWACLRHVPLVLSIRLVKHDKTKWVPHSSAPVWILCSLLVSFLCPVCAWCCKRGRQQQPSPFAFW